MSGITYSILAAFFWSIAIILFRKSGDTISPIPLNFLKCLVALLLLFPTLLFIDSPVFPDCPPSDWVMLALSAIIGITLADSLFFASLIRLGAGLNAVVNCLYLPMMILLSFLFLGEQLGWYGLLGGGFVLAALLVSAVYGKGHSLEKKELVSGIILGVLSILGLVVGVLMIKDVLNRSDVVWATTVRIFFAFLGMSILLVIHPNRRQQIREILPSASWKWAIPASIVGNYFALLCWLAGMKYTLVSLAAILNQLSAIMTFILAALFLNEKITLNRSISIALAITGAIIAVFN